MGITGSFTGKTPRARLDVRARPPFFLCCGNSEVCGYVVEDKVSNFGTDDFGFARFPAIQCGGLPRTM